MVGVDAASLEPVDEVLCEAGGVGVSALGVGVQGAPGDGDELGGGVGLEGGEVGEVSLSGELEGGVAVGALLVHALDVVQLGVLQLLAATAGAAA